MQSDQSDLDQQTLADEAQGVPTTVALESALECTSKALLIAGRNAKKSMDSETLESRVYSHPEKTACVSDNVRHRNSSCSSNTYLSESGADVEIAEVREKPASPCDLYFDLTSTVNVEVGSPEEPTESNLVLLSGHLTDPSNGHQEVLNTASMSATEMGHDGHGDGAGVNVPNAEVLPADETSIQQAEVDLFYANVGRSSRSEELFGAALEPMDLFYPDKEDAMFTEPAEMETERLSDVFGVFALQPAPVSEPLLPDIEPTGEEPDLGSPRVPGDHFDNGWKSTMENIEEVM